MTGLASLTKLLVAVILIAYGTDGSHAVQADITVLAGRQTYLSYAVLLSHQLSCAASGTNQLSALARVQLDVVDYGTNRNVLDRQCVARLDVSAGGRNNSVANRQTLRCDDVALVAILVLNQRDVCGTVRVVFDGQDGSLDVHLVALEVNDSVLLLVTAALVTYGDSAIAVTAGMLLLLFQKALFRLDLGKTAVVNYGHVASRRGGRSIGLYRHVFQLL